MSSSINKVSSETINLILRQMGAAEIKTYPTRTNRVKFNIDEGFALTYIYEVRDEDVLYMQRISPYPISRIKFNNDEEMIQFIKEDVTTFENARKSSNFDTFIHLTSNTLQLVEKLEDLFLFYNVSKESFDEMTGLIEHVYEKLEEVEGKSPKI